MVRTIAILTSGGDAPGMNPAVRAVARTAIRKNARVFGFYNGYQGILDDDLLELTSRSLTGMLDRGGSFLQTSRCSGFYSPESRAIAIRKLAEQRVDGVIVIGGDGSLQGALELGKLGVPCIGIPGTINNDIYGTETAIGVDTTSNTVVNMIDKIKDTARSHRRCVIVEVMGRTCGYLALSSAITTGAEMAIIPELRYNMPRILELLSSRYHNRLSDAIILLTEGVCDADTFIKRLQEAGGDQLKQEIGKVVPGDVQRGGRPSHFDRLIASRMGEFAVLAMLQGERNSMVGLSRGRLTLVDLEKVCTMKKQLPTDMLRMARHLGIEIGDAMET